MTNQLLYSAGYKYQTNSNLIVQTILRPVQPCVIDGYVFLDTDGLLRIYKGYAWDGCTNAPDTDINLLAGLVHDALYQLMQFGVLDQSFKHDADMMLKQIMIAQGASGWIARIFYAAVDTFGSMHIKPSKVIAVGIK